MSRNYSGHTGYVVDGSGNVYLHLASDDPALSRVVHDASGADHFPEDVGGTLSPISPETAHERLSPETRARFERLWIQFDVATVEGRLRVVRLEARSIERETGAVQRTAGDGYLASAVADTRRQREAAEQLVNLLRTAEQEAERAYAAWPDQEQTVDAMSD